MAGNSRSGGGSGFGYENLVGTVALAALLGRRALFGTGGPVEAVRFQRGADHPGFDDVVLASAGDGSPPRTVAIQAKSKVPAALTSPVASALLDAVLGGGAEGEQRTLVVGESVAWVRALDRICRRAARIAEPGELEQVLRTPGEEQEYVHTVLDHLLARAGTDHLTPVLRRALAGTSVSVRDDVALRDQALDLAREVTDGDGAEALVAVLAEVARDHAPEAGLVRHDDLLRALGGRDVGVRDPATRPRRGEAWIVPGPAPQTMAERPGLLGALRSAFADLDAAARFALVGEAGYGKSLTALAFVWECRARYEVVAWVDCSSPTTEAAAYDRVAAAMGLAVDPAAPIDEVRGVIHEHLARAGPWLLVLDNAPAAGRDGGLLPTTRRGHCLVLSQDPIWRLDDHRVLEPVGAEEGADFLLAVTGGSDRAVAGRIVARLHGLPLALDQAARTLLAGWSMPAYLDRLERTPRLVLDEGLPGTYARTIAATWQLAMEGAGAEEQELLETLAWMSPAPVPMHTLAETPGPEAVIAVRQAAQRLSRLGLARVGTDDDTVIVHGLLQAVMRDRASGQQQRAVGRAIRIVGRAAAFDEDEPDTWRATAEMVPHALAVAQRALAAGWQLDGVASILYEAGGYLAHRGAADQAYLVRLAGLAALGDAAALDAVRGRDLDTAPEDRLGDADIVPAARLGTDVAHPNRFAQHLNEMVVGLCDQSVPRAVEYALRAVAIATAAPDRDLDVLVQTLDNLGWAHQLAGQLDEAVAVYDRALALVGEEGFTDVRKVPHLHNDRSLVLWSQGLLVDAHAGVETAAALIGLSFDTRAAPAHVNIAQNLGAIEHALWRLTAAHDHLAAAQRIIRDRFEDDHLDVLIGDSNLGVLEYDRGEVDEGRALVESAFARSRAHRGAEDRETLIRGLFLARLDLHRGRAEAARDAVAAMGDHERETQDGSDLAIDNELDLARLWPVDLQPLGEARRLHDAVVRTSAPYGDVRSTADAHLAAVLWCHGEGQKAHALAVAVAGRSRRALGATHPMTLLRGARAALMGVVLGHPIDDATRDALLETLESRHHMGVDGFRRDLVGHGRPPLALDDPGRSRELLDALVRDRDLPRPVAVLVDGNIGRLALLADGTDVEPLRQAVGSSEALYGGWHPLTVLRRATALVATTATAGVDPTAVADLIRIPEPL